MSDLRNAAIVHRAHHAVRIGGNMDGYTYPGADTAGVLGGIVLTLLFSLIEGTLNGAMGGIAILAIIVSLIASGHAKGWLWTFGTRCLLGYFIAGFAVSALFSL